MEGIVKKHQQKFNKVRDKLDRWDDLQRLLLSHFSNASSILQRLQVIGDKKNYGCLRGVSGIEDAILRKQMESLETILLSIKNTIVYCEELAVDVGYPSKSNEDNENEMEWEEFHEIVLFLEKMVRDSKQQLRGGSHHLSTKQLQQKIGVRPSLSDCLDGLAILQEMHSSEYLLKTSVVSALMKVALTPGSSNLGALHQLLVDQPNIPKDEVQYIFDIIFAENIS